MYIGIDIGGTNTRIAGSTSINNIKLNNEVIFPTVKTFEEGIFEIIKRIRRITNNPKSVGIGLPGSISKDGQIFDGSINLKSWVNKPIIESLNHEFGCPVYIENDAVAQAYGEASQMPGEKFIYLVWGTGVGGSLVSYDGNKIVSTKLGRPYLDKWEKKYGGKHLETRFDKTAKQMNNNEWDEVMTDFKGSLFELSKQLETGTIVIGGGVVSNQKELISKILNDFTTPKVFISKLSDNVGVYGAISLIKIKTKN
jgi:predicted NBD/HSP70 family sugar kinase